MSGIKYFKKIISKTQPKTSLNKIFKYKSNIQKVKFGVKSVNISELKKTANKIRKHIIRMTTEAGSGHPGGSLSSTEIITALYFHILRQNPKDPEWDNRDRFILSAGHLCPVLYAAMAEAGYFPISELSTLRKMGARLQGHPSRLNLPGIETSTGSLGQGFCVAIGMALAGKMDNKEYTVYCLMGDGEQDEGSIWEGAMFASHHKLENLCAIIDYNGLQQDGKHEDIIKLEPLKKKYEAFGWFVIDVDGHDFAQLISAMEEAKTIKDKPVVIIARTIMGKGVSFMENDYQWHGKALSKELAEKALAELGENNA